MGVFTELSKTPGVFRILTSQLTAKFPSGMLSIALMLHVEHTFGDYTSAGIVLACMSIGQGVAGPISTRLMGVWGMRPVLIATSAVSATALTIIATVHAPLIVIGAIAFIMGLFTPPITAAVRTIYPKLVPGHQVAPLFSFDAALQEIIWIVGPVLAVFIAAIGNPALGLLVAAGFMIGGGAWFISAPQIGLVRIPRSRRRLGAVLTRPTVLLSTIIGFLFVASFASIELGIVSIYGHDGLESGIVLGFFALGSLIGGVTIGKNAPGPWSLVMRSIIVLAGTALCLLSFNMWWLCAVLLVGGFGTAPMISALFTMVSSTVKFSETAESYGWMQTGHLIGAALGSAIAGIAVDASGPLGAIWVSTGFLVLTVIVSGFAARWAPDLRGVDATPIPDTEPIQIPVDLPSEPMTLPPTDDTPKHSRFGKKRRK
ncbi:MAG: MFS transporter [Microbacteriaceae bacterium]